MLGGASGASAANRATDPYAGLDLFARALTLVERDYVEEREPDALVQAALEGMVKDLDRHSRWMSAEEYGRLRSETDGRYEGIGVEVRPEERGVRIARVLDDSPAQRDGLVAGDLLLELDGQSLAGLTQAEISERLKGPRGSEVTLLVEREGWDGPKTLTTTRDRIDTKAVLGARLDDVVYLRLVQFTSEIANDLVLAWDTHSAGEAPKALILDLRDNPGGLLDQAVAVSDLFLDEGVIVSTRSRVDGEHVHEATAGGLPADLPVFLLINGMSASASEILAGALQDTGRAILVGTRTYGKGSVQSVYENSDGSALKLTTGAYFTPSGEPVARAAGRKPDHEVRFPVDDAPALQLRARIEASDLSEEEREAMLALLDELPTARTARPSIPWHLPPAERVAVDPQLAKALELARASR